MTCNYLFIHVLSVTNLCISSGIDTNTGNGAGLGIFSGGNGNGNSNGNGNGNGNGSRVAGAGAGAGGEDEDEDVSDCVINVSRLTTLMSSPDIVPPCSVLSVANESVSLQKMQASSHGNTSQGRGKGGTGARALSVQHSATASVPQAAYLRSGLIGGCLVSLAHVIAVYPIAPDVLRLKLCDGCRPMEALADIGPWTVNLTYKAQMLEQTKKSIFSSGAACKAAYSSTEQQQVGTQCLMSPPTPPTPAEVAVCATWRGFQFTFLLSRVDDVTAIAGAGMTMSEVNAGAHAGAGASASAGAGAGADAVAVADRRKSLGKRDREGALIGTGGISDAPPRLSGSSSALFRVEAVTETDPRACAWALLSALLSANR